jgi:hypothetical protein
VYGIKETISEDRRLTHEEILFEQVKGRVGLREWNTENGIHFTRGGRREIIRGTW